jgi:hypothetical protein
MHVMNINKRYDCHESAYIAYLPALTLTLLPPFLIKQGYTAFEQMFNDARKTIRGV